MKHIWFEPGWVFIESGWIIARVYAYHLRDDPNNTEGYVVEVGGFPCSIHSSLESAVSVARIYNRDKTVKAVQTDRICRGRFLCKFYDKYELGKEVTFSDG